MSDSKLNLFSFTGKTKILHLTWLAFFISFFFWFNHALLLIAIKGPGGGLISDKFGRKKSLTIFLLGLVAGYFTMSQIESSWSLALAVTVTMMCSFFVQAGEGAVF